MGYEAVLAILDVVVGDVLQSCWVSYKHWMDTLYRDVKPQGYLQGGRLRMYIAVSVGKGYAGGDGYVFGPSCS